MPLRDLLAGAGRRFGLLSSRGAYHGFRDRIGCYLSRGSIPTETRFSLSDCVCDFVSPVVVTSSDLPPPSSTRPANH
jgi:hypothetical protein